MNERFLFFMQNNTEQIHKGMIFDFMRTLYDPETDSLVEGVYELLDTLHKKDWYIVLISRNEGQRDQLLDKYGIRKYFDEVYFVPEKTQKLFNHIVECMGQREIYVVGDRIYDEIYFGNQSGCKTIWFRSGKFYDDTPRNEQEEPWKIIEKFSDIARVIS